MASLKVAGPPLPPNDPGLNGGFYTQADGRTFLYCKTWNPDGKPRAVVTFCHGLGEHLCRYEHVFSQFAANGIKVTGFDLRGSGRSTGTRGDDGSLDDLVHDIRIVFKLNHEGNNIPHFIMGHSLGGLHAIYFGVVEHELPIAGYILSAPNLRPAFAPAAVKVFLGNLLSGVLPTTTLATGLDASAVSRDPEVVKRYKADPLVHDRITLRSAVKATQLGAKILNESTSQFTPPSLLIMHSKADKLTSYAASQEFFEKVNVKDKTLRSFDDLYHELHNEPEKDQVIKEYIDWILQRGAPANSSL